MKNFIFILFILVFTISQSSCDLLGINEGKTCGDKQDGYYFRTSHGTGFFTDDATKSYLLDRYYTPGSLTGRSSVIFEKWVQHVCPDKHVKVDADIGTHVQSDINVTAKAYWYFFYEQPIKLNVSNDGLTRTWKGKDEVGLKQVYGDAGEGEFTIQATLDFPYQGSFEADTAFLFKNLLNVQLSTEFYIVK
jgi:hypothetical protein